MSLSRDPSCDSLELASRSSCDSPGGGSGGTSSETVSPVFEEEELPERPPKPSSLKFNGLASSTEKLHQNGLQDGLFMNKDSLAHDLSFLATMPELCDVTFLVGEDRQPVCGVRAILAARSKVFRKMLYTDATVTNHAHNVGVIKKQKKKQSYKASDGYIEKYDFRGQPTVIVRDFEPEVFKQLIEYVHTGSVMLQARTLLGLMNASDHYGLEELKQACIQFMEHCVTIDTVCSLLTSAEKYIQYKSTKILVQKMFDFVDQNAETILSLGAFSTLPQHVVRIVLSRDDLQATEKSKFEAAFRWSLKYTEDHPELSIMEVFEPFVDVIDFFQIPAKHLMQNVKPAGVVEDSVILTALAYQADPKSVEHIRPSSVSSNRMRVRTPTPSESDFRLKAKNSPKFRRVKSSGQPLNVINPSQQNEREPQLTTPLQLDRLFRGGSVPPFSSDTPRDPQRVGSHEVLREDIHPNKIHHTRDRFQSQSSSHMSVLSGSSPPLSPSPQSPSIGSYRSSTVSVHSGSSFEQNTSRESLMSGGGSDRGGSQKRLTYNPQALDMLVSLSNTTNPVEV